MAKSLRSKWRRKCRAVKRVRYGQRELERLKKTLGIDETKKEIKEVDLSEISEIAEVTTLKEIRAKEAKEDEDQLTMETDSKKIKVKRPKDGSHPIWMHQRKIKRIKIVNNRKKKEKKRLTKADKAKSYKKK